MPSNGGAYVLAKEGEEYLLYIDIYTPDKMYLSLPPSNYQGQWFDPTSGNVTQTIPIIGIIIIIKNINNNNIIIGRFFIYNDIAPRREWMDGLCSSN